MLQPRVLLVELIAHVLEHLDFVADRSADGLSLVALDLVLRFVPRMPVENRRESSRQRLPRRLADDMSVCRLPPKRKPLLRLEHGVRGVVVGAPLPVLLVLDQHLVDGLESEPLLLRAERQLLLLRVDGLPVLAAPMGRC